jgi:ABC-type lipoprotein export system ATPase subunit
LNRSGQTVLLVTHDPALARLVATRVVEVRDGKLTEAVAA